MGGGRKERLGAMMAEDVAAWIWLVVGGYGVVGVVFAVLFAWRGVGRVDPAAVHAGWGFRVMIVPGAAALWPWMLAKWRRAGRLEKSGGHG